MSNASERPVAADARPPGRSAADVAPLLAEVRRRLADLYGSNLAGAYLFGSYARGEAEPDSDIDILVVLRDFERYHLEVLRTSVLRSELSLEHGIPISSAFVRLAEWDDPESIFPANVREDAIAL